jgi:endonuclease/exonuclease/phosphatase family metal-dependent hydrolase
MSANITSGNQQTYDDGKGIHIFKAFKPDIVVIQEFNYTSGATALTKEAFGDDFYHYKGTGRIPNGIISRWPILSHGTWDSNITSDREWEWAIIDIPGDRDLLAVSVHLHGKDHNKEFQPLLNQITAKQKEGNYYVILGGDFNTDKRDSAVSSLCSKNSILTCSSKSGMYPVDQNENGMTSGERDDYYDYVIFDKTLDTYEIPITIGSHTYSHGHVIDSRVYSDLGELGDIPPVQAEDSWLCETSPHCDGNRETRTNMQHMAVIRDVTYSY